MALLRWQSYPASEAAASLARPTLKGCFPASEAAASLLCWKQLLRWQGLP